MSIVDRLMLNISPEPNTGCWLWMGATDNNGYGAITVDRRTRRTHAVSYECRTCHNEHQRVYVRRKRSQCQ